jgi:NADPH:quinone reductase-like Zn-dependent oxidoreductase
MRVLIIGATGRIGRFATLRALDAGHDVRALVRDTEDADVPEVVAVRAGDLRDPAAVMNALTDVDAVISAVGVRATPNMWPVVTRQRRGRWSPILSTSIATPTKHAKAVAATGEGLSLLAAAQIPIGDADSPDPADAATIVARKMTRAVGDRFVEAMRRHRLWTRELEVHLPFEA